MKNKIISVGVAGLILFGGAIGAGATTTKNIDDNSHIISIEDAKKIAQHNAAGIVDHIELEENEQGLLFYDVEIEQQISFIDIDLEIDAKSGEVIKMEKEKADDDGDFDNDSLQFKQNVKVSEVKAIATAIIDTPGKVMEVDLESDNGYYEIDIQTSNGEIEVKVDAENGEIIGKVIDDDNV